MTEIPEHLLRRSRERRAAMGGEGDVEGTPAPGDAVATTPAATPAAAAAPVAAVAPPPPPPPPRPRPYVEAAERRRKIPVWALPVLALLPIWGFFYAESLREPEVVLTGPLAEGEEVFLRACSGCHGADGGGGAGRKLNGGEVLLTFPADLFDQQLEFVKAGSAPYAGKVYGDPERPGGPHEGLSFTGAAMPGQGEEYNGSLTDEEVLAAVCHERVLSGEDPLPQCTGEAPAEGAAETTATTVAGAGDGTATTVAGE